MRLTRLEYTTYSGIEVVAIRRRGEYMIRVGDGGYVTYCTIDDAAFALASLEEGDERSRDIVARLVYREHLTKLGDRA